ncbi:hypothetical protein ACFX13_038989 [Malus domestica]
MEAGAEMRQVGSKLHIFLIWSVDDKGSCYYCSVDAVVRRWWFRSVGEGQVHLGLKPRVVVGDVDDHQWLELDRRPIAGEFV